MPYLLPHECLLFAAHNVSSATGPITAPTVVHTITARWTRRGTTVALRGRLVHVIQLVVLTRWWEIHSEEKTVTISVRNFP